MARNPYFDILFEPVRIGPVTTKNRFYQVPHATAHGYKMPNGHAGVRGIKAEGGWGVVNTDLVSIHPTSDDAPFPYLTIWDDADIAAHALMVEKVHEHGANTGRWQVLNCGTVALRLPIYFHVKPLWAQRADVLHTMILFKVGLLINLISKRSGDGMWQQPDGPKRLVLISFMSMQRMTI